MTIKLGHVFVERNYRHIGREKRKTYMTAPITIGKERNFLRPNIVKNQKYVRRRCLSQI